MENRSQQLCKEVFQLMTQLAPTLKPVQILTDFYEEFKKIAGYAKSKVVVDQVLKCKKQ